MGSEELLINTVMVLIALLFVAGISALLLKRIHFPFTVGLVIVGVAIAFLGDSVPAIGEGLTALELGPELIMFVFIPILIFESAINIDVRLLLKNIVPTLVLAGPGLLLSTAIIGFLVSALTSLPLGSALIFGCLISATDPVAVIALFKDVGAPKRLNILVEGESLFNDATAIVTFQIILAVIATGILDSQTVTSGLGNFVVVFGGGLIVGLGFGYLLAMAIRLIGEEPLIHITLTVVVAYGAFIVAEHFLHTSGIMAVLGAGLMIGYYGSLRYSHRVKEYLEVFWEDAVFVANSLIFLMLGLSEKNFLTNVTSNVSGLLVPILIVIVIVIAVRALIVFGLVPLVNRIPGQQKVSFPYRAVMFWGGLRGAVAVALAISLPSTFPFRWQIIDFTFGVTLFTLLVNGTTMSWLMKRLGLDQPPLLTEFAENFVRVRSKQKALARLDEYQTTMNITTDVEAGVRAEYEQELEQAEKRLQEIREEIGQTPEMRHNLLWLRALNIQRQVYEKRYDDGLLTVTGLRELDWDLRDQEQSLEVNDPDGQTLPVLPAMLKDTASPEVSTGKGMFAQWRMKQLVQSYEMVATLVAASSAVLDKLDHLREFAGATDEDVQQLRSFYETLRQKATERQRVLEQAFESACANVQVRQLHQLAADAELDVVRQLELRGELPERIAERIEQSIEARATS